MTTTKSAYIHPLGKLERLTGRPTGAGMFVWFGVAPMLCLGIEIMRYGALIAVGPFGFALIWQTQEQME
jgi:hypothetical protein